MATSLRQLASRLAFAEGKKKEVSIGNVREILARLRDEIKADLREGRADTINLLLPKKYAVQNPGK